MVALPGTPPSYLFERQHCFFLFIDADDGTQGLVNNLRDDSVFHWTIFQKNELTFFDSFHSLSSHLVAQNVETWTNVGRAGYKQNILYSAENRGCADQSGTQSPQRLLSCIL